MSENIKTKTKTKAKPRKKRAKAKKNLVIVESPAKAKTLKKFLGSTYKIEASMGHVRDLPKSQMGVDIENDYEPKYITIRGKGELLAELRKEAKKAKTVYLATDPDREGEAISWHLSHSLRLEEGSYKRIVFNEITKKAVKDSLKEARDIDMDLVDAQQARRILDRLVGYTISPLLWEKVKKNLSAGRVQSVALAMICEREEEISNFIPEEYWSLEVDLENKNKFHISSNLRLDKEGKLDIKNEDEMNKILADIKGQDYLVESIKKTSRNRNPNPPFTTSTMQQEASRYLSFTAQKTMMIAQRLYEGVDVKGLGTTGLVSYIRTDSVRVSDEAYFSTVDYIDKELGKEYQAEERPVYKSKGKAQDAHESIRPVDINLKPIDLKADLSDDEYKLYKLVWERYLASQMASASFEVLTIDFDANDYKFRTTGTMPIFDGFLKIYNRGNENKKYQELPKLEEGEVLKNIDTREKQHFTKHPPRYNEASLIKTLEELGIGRPSTFVPIISTIQNRRYVIKEEKAFYPTELGEIVNEIMVDYFSDIVDLDFTAKLENELDKVEDGDVEWKDVIREFYPTLDNAYKIAEKELEKITIKDEETDEICEKCGKNLVIKYGSYGKFLACPGYPECRNTKPFFEDAKSACPECGKRVMIKKTKKGRRYYGCEDYPDCEFMSWAKPTEEKCPVCASYLVEKGKGGKTLKCSNSECGFTKEKEETKELEEV